MDPESRRQMTWQMAFNIFKRRNLLRINQAELAKKVGVCRSAINRIESGHANPSVFLMYHVAQILGTTVEELLIKNEDQMRTVLNNEKMIEQKKIHGGAVTSVKNSDKDLGFQRIVLKRMASVRIPARDLQTNQLICSFNGDFLIKSSHGSEMALKGQIVEMVASHAKSINNMSEHEIEVLLATGSRHPFRIM